MARRTRQRLVKLIQKSGVDVSTVIGRFAAKVELVHPNNLNLFEKNEHRLLPTPPFSPSSQLFPSPGQSIFFKTLDNGKNCSEGAQLLLLLKGST